MSKFILVIFLSIASFACSAQQIPVINNDSVYIIGKPIKIGKIIIAQFDLSTPFDWFDATKLCSKLGYGWRLPNVEELIFMFQNRNLINGFKDKLPYWSSTEFGSNDAWVQGFNKYGFTTTIYKQDNNYVRAVRSY